MKKFLGLKPIVWIMIIVGVLLLVCLNKGVVGYDADINKCWKDGWSRTGAWLNDKKGDPIFEHSDMNPLPRLEQESDRPSSTPVRNSHNISVDDKSWVARECCSGKATSTGDPLVAGFKCGWGEQEEGVNDKTYFKNNGAVWPPLLWFEGCHKMGPPADRHSLHTWDNMECNATSKGACNKTKGCMWWPLGDGKSQAANSNWNRSEADAEGWWSDRNTVIKTQEGGEACLFENDPPQGRQSNCRSGECNAADSTCCNKGQSVTKSQKGKGGGCRNDCDCERVPSGLQKCSFNCYAIDDTTVPTEKEGGACHNRSTKDTCNKKHKKKQYCKLERKM